MDEYARRGVHTILLTENLDHRMILSAGAKNDYFSIVPIHSDFGLLNVTTYSEITKTAAGVMIFNLVIDYDIDTSEHDSFRKLFHHLKNVGFARIGNCKRTNQNFLRDLCNDFNIYYKPVAIS